ncbi:hypothetical protein GWR56_06565 [Mucilaginibacter sp. 14171R-50]|uniref:hypothetical protein n=1 Tax=Mucilaginibacter sp. 14171R-50 TaxID=2703789 RepID=UPI00138CCF78|nr:hypothetical protein [Mucilaginibacter sp. 14171R-50]QHS55218.1 hypothetical protein GWR56_06565 [Mucilaginibacter sp. 14171R-50]
MWFLKKKQANEHSVNDKVAEMIAGRIVKWQRNASQRLNQRVRRYSKESQLRWFWLFCGLALMALICSVLITSRLAQMPRIRNSALPVHIGQSSDGPPKPHSLKKTDSLNHQK